jgi:aminoglycoside phosphotransferase (APT) family kinase protein
VRWLTDSSPTTVAAAVRVVAPELAGLSLDLAPRRVEVDPLWWSSTAVMGGRFVVKFAWSEPAARRLAHEIGVLTALSHLSCVPEVVAAGTDPLLLITRRVPGASLFAVVDSIDLNRAGRQVAEFLAALHRPETRAAVEAVVGPLPDATLGPGHPQSTEVLRESLVRWLRPDQWLIVVRWLDWADATLARPRPGVLVHADLHGDNQVWAGGELRLVVDFENVSVAEPEYDLRALPGTGPGAELVAAVMRHYERLAGRGLAVDRVLAWHVRTVLGDALWRSEAGVPLPDHRTPAAWVDDLATRL